jgi:hypothetical protein
MMAALISGHDSAVEGRDSEQLAARFDSRSSQRRGRLADKSLESLARDDGELSPSAMEGIARLGRGSP